jgi:tRNA threonylcarbamoyladenosine modification (KEOPS) complex  Pcc1 subunit
MGRCVSTLSIKVSEEHSKAILIALSPEIASSMGRAKVSLSPDRILLKFTFSADSIASLRAMVNTYVRWVIVIDKVLKLLQSK